jgi:hypothetical protein
MPVPPTPTQAATWPPGPLFTLGRVVIEIEAATPATGLSVYTPA